MAGLLQVFRMSQFVCFTPMRTHDIEEQLRDCLEAGIPGVRVSLSSEILPEFKEFERMSTTVVNAYVLPKVSDYVNRLQRALSEVEIEHLCRSCSPTVD